MALPSDRALAEAEPVVSALRASIPSAVRRLLDHPYADDDQVLLNSKLTVITTGDIRVMAAEIERLTDGLLTILAGDFNCSPHQRFMAAQGVAERALSGEGEAA